MFRLDLQSTVIYRAKTTLIVILKSSFCYQYLFFLFVSIPDYLVKLRFPVPLLFKFMTSPQRLIDYLAGFVNFGQCSDQLKVVLHV